MRLTSPAIKRATVKDKPTKVSDLELLLSDLFMQCDEPDDVLVLHARLESMLKKVARDFYSMNFEYDNSKLYTCPVCGNKVSFKTGLGLSCNSCNYSLKD